jgi:hypothetical protein
VRGLRTDVTGLTTLVLVRIIHDGSSPPPLAFPQSKGYPAAALRCTHCNEAQWVPGAPPRGEGTPPGGSRRGCAPFVGSATRGITSVTVADAAELVRRPGFASICDANAYKGAGPLRRSPRGRRQSRVGDGTEAYRGPVALPHATGGQHVEGLSGEPARLAAVQSAGRLVAAANGRLQQKRS